MLLLEIGRLLCTFAYGAWYVKTVAQAIYAETSYIISLLAIRQCVVLF